MTQLHRRRFLATTAAGAAALPLGTRAQEAPQEAKPRLPGHTKHTRFAINVEMWWRKLPFLERLRRVAELGFPAIEFWPFKNKPLPEIAALTRELKLEVAQFTAWGFTPGLNDPKNHDRFVRTLDEALAAAKTLRCKKMTVVAGNDQPGMTQRSMHDHVITALRRVAKTCESADVMLILEPMNVRVDHKGHCLYGSPDAVRICRAVDSSHVKINWDLYHMQISEGDLCGRLREGFDQVGYLQLADHPGRREPGTGEIHYPRVLEEAWNLGYRGYVGTECWPTDPIRAAHRLAAADTW